MFFSFALIFIQFLSFSVRVSSLQQVSCLSSSASLTLVPNLSSILPQYPLTLSMHTVLCHLKKRLFYQGLWKKYPLNYKLVFIIHFLKIIKCIKANKRWSCGNSIFFVSIFVVDFFLPKYANLCDITFFL